MLKKISDMQQIICVTYSMWQGGILTAYSTNKLLYAADYPTADQWSFTQTIYNTYLIYLPSFVCALDNLSPSLRFPSEKSELSTRLLLLYECGLLALTSQQIALHWFGRGVASSVLYTKAGLRKMVSCGCLRPRPFPLLLSLWGPVRPRYFPSLIDSRERLLAAGAERVMCRNIFVCQKINDILSMLWNQQEFSFKL